jgi:transposase
MKNITTIGLDIAKNVFEVCCQDDKGKTMERKRLMRFQVLAWFGGQSPCLVGVEACCGAHYWAREITKRGHTVRIIPPQHVKPFVRTNKSDAHDAQAICRALREPDMTFVSIADPCQQDSQALHRVRSRIIRERTALINQMRGFLLEYGIALPKRIEQARKGLEKLIQGPSEVLSPLIRSLFEDHYRELQAKDQKIEAYTAHIERQVQEDPAATRVRKVLGIGPLTASALVLKVRHESTYRNGRHFSAAIGLVPRHDGTGGKIFIRGMSKRGDRYLRTLLIHGARAVVSHVEEKTDALSLWVKRLIERRGTNKAVVALANKNARIAWRLIAKEEEYNPALVVGPPALAA